MPAKQGSRPDLVSQALHATRPSKKVALWPRFSPAAPGAWSELVKDVAAIANSGGGAIVIGVDERGVPTGWNTDALLRIDRDEILDAFARHIGERLDSIEISRPRKRDRAVVVLAIPGRSASPLVFERAGGYVDADGEEHTAFGRGTVYFRHGAKSKPASARDLARFGKQLETRIRRDLLKHLREVSSAPVGSEVIIVPPASAPTGSVGRFRVVDDPTAAVLARTDFDVTHPYRQTELIQAVNTRIGRHVVGPYEIQCVRKVHRTDEREEYFHRPKFGSPQYSEAFVAWLVGAYTEDPAFFEKAKVEAKR